MVTLRCLSKTGKKPSRFVLDIESLSQPVSDLRKSVSTQVKLNPLEIELIYSGRALKDDQKIEHYGLKPGCTIHVLFKKYEEAYTAPTSDFPEGVNQVNTIRKLAEISGKYRQSIEKVLCNSEVIDNIIEATPGLASDHVAVALLRDHVLLQQAAKDDGTMTTLLREHPSLGMAVQHIVAVINEEVSKSKKVTGSSGSNSGEETIGNNGIVSSYSIDSLSEEDDDGQLAGPSWGSVHQNRPITADQLATALAMATNVAVSSSPSTVPVTAGTSASSPSTAPTETTSASRGHPPGLPFTTGLFSQASWNQQQSRLISPSFFQQAMQAALGSADSADSSSQSGTEEIFDEEDAVFGALLAANGGSGGAGRVSEAAVDQLRQMGITDEEVARRALEASGGDLRAALDLIFGDGMMF